MILLSYTVTETPQGRFVAASFGDEERDISIPREMRPEIQIQTVISGEGSPSTKECLLEALGRAQTTIAAEIEHVRSLLPESA